MLLLVKQIASSQTLASIMHRNAQSRDCLAHDLEMIVETCLFSPPHTVFSCPAHFLSIHLPSHVTPSLPGCPPNMSDICGQSYRRCSVMHLLVVLLDPHSCSHTLFVMLGPWLLIPALPDVAAAGISNQNTSNPGLALRSPLLLAADIVRVHCYPALTFINPPVFQPGIKSFECTRVVILRIWIRSTPHSTHHTVSSWLVYL